MSNTVFSPPLTPAQQVVAQLQSEGFAVLAPADVALWSGCTLAQLQQFQSDWDNLPPDEYLRDGGRYRRRRHASFEVRGDAVQRVPHRAHWQPLEYNALHGGMERWFAPMLDATAGQPAWQQLVRALAQLSQAVFEPRAAAPVPWFVEAHQFRIDTTDGIGRPTPEGAHRDGVDLVAVFLVARAGIKGGETRVFEAGARAGQRFTLAQPWSLLLLDDARMVHESTPIQPLEGAGHRDTLVVTCRRGSFQGAQAVPLPLSAPALPALPHVAALADPAAPVAAPLQPRPS